MNIKKSIQLNLDGEKQQQQHHLKVYSNIYIEHSILWAPTNRIIETLKYFYFTRTVLSKTILIRIYKPKITGNSIAKHIQELLKEKLIRLIAQNVGRNNSEKYYEIASRGEKVYETYLKERSL